MRFDGLIKKVFSLWMGYMAVCLLTAGVAYADTNPKPLPQDEAFSVSATVTDKNAIITSWEVAPGYHIYADKVTFAIVPATTIKTALPEGNFIQDDARGKVRVYSGNFIIPVEAANPLTKFALTVAYQGCSSEGFCYPPTEKTFNLAYAGGVGGNTGPDEAAKATNATNHVVTGESVSALMTDQYGVQALLAQEHRGFLLFIFLMLGVLLAFTPCVLPMLPILTGIIAGQKKHASDKKILFLAAIYVLGMALTYSLAGVLAAYAGGSLQVWLQTPSVIIFTSAIFVLLALSLFEFYELPFSRRWQNKVSSWSQRHEGGTALGVFFMGVLSTLVVTPCVTAPLVGVLLYIGRTGDVLLGGSALFTMGIGMGLPLMLFGVSLGHWLPKSGKWMHAITKSFGVVLLGMAIWLLSRIMPMTMTFIVLGMYLIGIALFFSLYLTKVIGRHKINHTLGVTAGVLGVMMIVSTVGTPALVSRWTGDVGTPKIATTAEFTVVRSPQELMGALQAAKESNQPALVDFYADWCTSCVEMDEQVFAHKTVQSALKPFKLIRVDLSANSKQDQGLMQQYKVIAPPTVLFFNSKGNEVDNRRIVGELGVKTFLQRIQVFMAKSCDKKTHC